jgi:8-oxo-dGTP pyrophosphatase MutT (NUDIX family)
VLDLLGRYQQCRPEDAASAKRIRELVLAHPDCLERSCLPGHLTASAWIVSHDHRHFLLTHHRKLDRWLQLGGHADGDPDLSRVALREAQEESGLLEFEFFLTGGELLPIDLDIHRIPAFQNMPEHQHHDIRFLLTAKPGQELRISDESLALRWFERERLAEVPGGESLRRLGRVATALLDSA